MKRTESGIELDFDCSEFRDFDKETLEKKIEVPENE